MFVTNESEKRHMANPDANRLFNIKSKLPQKSTNSGLLNGESVSRTLFEDARAYEMAREEPAN